MTIRNHFHNNGTFSFKKIVKTEVIKKTKNLEIKKGSLSINIPTKIIKEFDDLFSVFITENFNLCLNKKFREIVKIAEVLQSIKRRIGSRKTTSDQLALYLRSQNIIRELCIIK